MIRKVLRVLSLFCNFFNDETAFGPVSTRFKDTNDCYCNDWGINTTISIHYLSKFVRNQNFINMDFVSLQGFCGQSPTVLLYVSHAIILYLPYNYILQKVQWKGKDSQEYGLLTKPSLATSVSGSKRKKQLEMTHSFCNQGSTELRYTRKVTDKIRFTV